MKLRILFPLLLSVYWLSAALASQGGDGTDQATGKMESSTGNKMANLLRSRNLQGGTCGGGSRGNGICADGTCCSQWGWCGTSSAHCTGTTPTAPGPSPSGTCGGGSRGNGICADGTCCSQYGWCGTSSAHCSGTTPAAPGPSPSGTCGGGSRGNGICADGTCCSQYGWCGTSSAHCSGTTPTAPGPSPAPPSGGTRAYVTYHNYFQGQPLTQVACSDGANGLITRWGYSTIDPMAPYVSAVSNLSWNSPNCGKCYAVTSGGKTIYVTAIDQCGPGPGGEMHFDLHPTAFNELLGSAGVAAGSAYVTYTVAPSSQCRGNKG